MPNRLAEASSPYLLQHAENPVDWYEWGDEALAAARERDRPIFLSVGYSACHWCHVMAHESFEDPETADYMNEHFVNIKVDREERPDIDRIYMDAVQAMTGRGGWPMSVFLTPDGRPVLAGTYYPREAMGNHPSFRRVLEAVNDAWENRRDELDDQADRLTEAVQRRIPPLEKPPGAESIDVAVDALAANFDEEHGGFGAAPKFPQAPSLEVLLRALAADGAGPRTGVIERMLRTTLDRMAAGGIYDHLGGGFARYAVDRVWLVPHFEKMLYDNALLARVYLRAWQLLGTDRYRDVAVETLDYLLRDMIDDTGGLHAAEDADSEGEEGKFYVWTLDELHDVLGEDADFVARLYGITEAGNFEGANILHLAATPEQVAKTTNATVEEVLAARRRADELLFERRNDRIRPGRDDKVITAWNGLALRALAEAGAVLGSERYLEGAVRVARCALDRLIDSEGRLLRSIRDGRGDVPGFCDDYAALAVGLLTLYQATGDVAWFEAGRDLATDMIELFADPDSGGFFATGRDAEALISRPKNHMDNPTPSDNALAAEALQMLHALTGERALRDRIEGVYRASGRLMAQYPTAVGHLIAVRAVDPPREVAIVGPEPSRRALSDVIWETFRPGIVLAEGDDGNGGVPLLQDRGPAGERARAYVCENFVCALPVETPEALRAQLE